MSQRIVFIGAGNLATHLALEFKEQGCQIVQVYSQTEASAFSLADKVQSDYVVAPEKIIPDADIYFVVLKDSVVEEVLSRVVFRNQLLVHCSGSLPLSSLHSFSTNTGVFYPLQTFSKSLKVDFKEVPVFVEANSAENEKLLLQLAAKISEKVCLLNSEKRLILHIAAVFACNFVNHLYTIASDVLNSKSLPFALLQPLIQETALKVMQMEPQRAQTGPAVRFDRNIIDAHLHALESLTEFRELYSYLSENIHNYHKINSNDFL